GLGLPRPDFFAVGAHHHGNQAHAVLHRGGHQAVPGRLGVAGLDPVHVTVAPQQAIAVGLTVVVVLEVFFRVDLVVLGKIPDQGLGHQRHVVGGGEVVVPGQAGGVFKVGVHHPQQLGLLVHNVGKGRLGAGDVLGEDDGGVVAGLDNHPPQQVDDGGPAVGHQRPHRAAAGPAAELPGV